jgi:hypothetical protein
MLRPAKEERILIEGHHDRKKRKKKQESHHHHHQVHGGDIYAGSNACVWLFFIVILLLVTFWIVAAFAWPAGWEGHEDWHKDGGSEPFVFRKRHNFAAKRPRSECTSMAGEVWDNDLAMCAPKFNAPLALEHAILNITMPACSSFFDSMCGKWNQQHHNEDRSFSYAYHRNQRLVERLISNAPSNSPIAQFHRSCVELPFPAAAKESEIEFRHVVESVAGDLKSYGDLPSTLGRLARSGYGGPFVLSIERHPMELRMVPLFTLDDTFRNWTSAHLTAIFERTRHLTGWDTRFLMDRVRRTLKVLDALNQHLPAFDADWNYENYLQGGRFAQDLVRFDSLPKWHTPYVDHSGWNSYFQSLDGSGLRFAAAQTVWLLDAKADGLRWLLESGLPSMELMDWRAYVEFSIIYHCHQFIPLLPNNVYFRAWDVNGPLASLPYGNEAEYRFHQRVPRTNLSVTMPSASQCYAITAAMLPGHVAEAFLAMQEQTSWARAKELVRKMTAEIVERFEQLVRSTSWLRDAEAKEAALRKLSTMKVRVVEPDEWSVEEFGARISGDRYDHNLNLIRRYRVHRNLQLWHKDAANSVAASALALFGMPLTEVNAFYSGPQNSITILAGLLQRPFYDAAYDELSVYALLGSIIGHELSHALDAHGLRWDAEGRYQPLSIFGNNSASMANFATVIRCVVDEFGPAPVGCNQSDLYGLSTLNEDIADLTGVRLAYHAYFDNRPAATLGQRQHFFMMFAQMWCSTYDDNHMCESVMHDEHAIPEFRVDRTLRNLAEFQHDFACHSGTAMHRPQVCAVYG